jgi:hypothetical protein
MREHGESALRDEIAARYSKELRIIEDKESIEPDADLELIGFSLNLMKCDRVLANFAGTQSDSTTIASFIGFQFLLIEVCRYYGNRTGSNWLSFDLTRNFSRI